MQSKEDDTAVKLQNEINRLKTENDKLKKESYEKDNIIRGLTDALQKEMTLQSCS